MADDQQFTKKNGISISGVFSPGLNLWGSNFLDHRDSKTIAMETREKEAIDYVQNLKGFYMHGILFLVIITGLAVLNLVISPDELWVLIVAVAWLAGLGIHAAVMFTAFKLVGPEWEQRHFRKRMGALDE